MQRVWVFAANAVTVSGVDFIDPAHAGEPDVRERGVRLEVRPVREAHDGSVYASDPISLEPAVVRVDLLESAPYAADRMHWHPTMRSGEPGGRTFEPAMVEDPGRWLGAFLADLDHDLGADTAAIAAMSDEIVVEAMRTLGVAREPWPDVQHDARGLAGL